LAKYSNEQKAAQQQKGSRHAEVEHHFKSKLLTESLPSGK